MSALFNNKRGQGYIAESLFAILLISGVLFTASSAFQQPNRLETVEDRQLLQELEGDLTQIVDKSIQDGTLKHDILNYNEEFDRYVRDASYQNSEGLYLGYPNTKFGERLRTVYEERNAQNNVTVSIAIEVTPATNGTNTRSARNLEQQKPEGTPFLSKGSAGQRMVVVKRNVVLHGSDRLQAPPGYYRHNAGQNVNVTENSNKKLHELESDDEFLNVIPPAKPIDQIGENDIYNVVEIRVVTWF